MKIKISRIRLKGILSLTSDRDLGCTMHFKNDPLESVHVSSSFDPYENIKNLIQIQIETQLRTLFSNDLPQIIHQLSLEFLHSNASTMVASNVDASADRNFTQKWLGNDSDSDLLTDFDSLILPRSLSTSQLQGLNVYQDNTLLLKSLSNETLVSRSDSSPSMKKSKSGFRRLRTGDEKTTFSTSSAPLLTSATMEAFRVTALEPEPVEIVDAAYKLDASTFAKMELLEYYHQTLAGPYLQLKHVVMRTDPMITKSFEDVKKRHLMSRRTSPIKSSQKSLNY